MAPTCCCKGGVTMGLAVGIDLGTTNTVVAAVRDGVVSVLRDADGQGLLPSVVSFHPSGSVVVGRPALERRVLHPPHTPLSGQAPLQRPGGSPRDPHAPRPLP